MRTQSDQTLLPIPATASKGGIDAVRHAVHQARAALAQLLAQAGVDATKSRESSRVLDVNRGLIWRVSRVVAAQDDVTAAANIPGQVGLDRLLDACRSKGVDPATIQTCEIAVRAFHGVVQSHSGDRRTLEILLANSSGQQSTSLGLENARRALFEGGCAVWGVRAALRLRCMVLAPNRDDPTMIDDAGVGGYIGFRRLRQTPWPMSYKGAFQPSGEANTGPTEELIDPDGVSESGLGLIREFCDPPDPPMSLIRTPRATRHELGVSPTAEDKAITCVFGSMFRRIYSRTDFPSDGVGGMLVLDTPVERCIFDAFVHRSLDLSGPPEALLLDRLTHPHGYRAEDVAAESLPLDNTPRLLGPGTGGTVTPHLPWYPRLFERICTRIGRDPDEFVGYRVEMVYPPIPTAMLVRFFRPGT